MSGTAHGPGALHVVHVIQALRMGGMENGLVNLINRSASARLRHTVVCLDDYSDFRDRITAPVAVHALHKRPGKDPLHYARLWSCLRRLRPDVVHTRNLPGLDAQLVARLAGVRATVHGEHGWDVHDLHGTSRKYIRLRRWVLPRANAVIAVSADIARWLTEVVGVPEKRVVHVCNGVDTDRFRPDPGARTVLPAGFARTGDCVFAWVGRLQQVKDPLTLVEAFLTLAESRAAAGHDDVRLVIAGDGPLRTAVEQRIARSGAAGSVWMAGARDDVPRLLAAADVLTLSSLNEGISNTILEAMATGLPVVATRCGGNPELVIDGDTGLLGGVGDVAGLGAAMGRLAGSVDLRVALGAAARKRAVEQFSLRTMVDRYLAVYRGVAGGSPASES